KQSTASSLIRTNCHERGPPSRGSPDLAGQTREGRMFEHVRSRGVAYLVAVGAMTAALLIRLALNPVLGQDALFLLFTLAVFAAGLYGGWRPGLVATGL